MTIPQLSPYADVALLLLRLMVGVVFFSTGLILIMLGAIQKKIAVWHTGFWGKNGSGWHYDLLFVTMNLVIATTGGGRFVLMK
jgi:uncharacterized membrane protein YphA (DoxX/SURF4 family)